MTNFPGAEEEEEVAPLVESRNDRKSAARWWKCMWYIACLIPCFIIFYFCSIGLYGHAKGWQDGYFGTLYGRSWVVSTSYGDVEYYKMVGASGDGYGGNILFIPSSAGGYEEALIPGMMDAYLNAGLNVITMSRPGHLRTPISSGKTWAAQADLASGLLDYLGLGKVVVMSNDGGGPVAVHFAARHPDKTAALILNVATLSATTGAGSLMTSMLGSQTLKSFPVVQTYVNKLIHKLPANPIPSYLASCWFMSRGIIDPILYEYSDFSVREKMKEHRRIFKNKHAQTFIEQSMMTFLPLGGHTDGVLNDAKNTASMEYLPFEAVTAKTRLAYARRDAPAGTPVWMGLLAKERMQGSVTLDIGENSWHYMQVSTDWPSIEAKHVALATAALNKVAGPPTAKKGAWSWADKPTSAPAPPPPTAPPTAAATPAPPPPTAPPTAKPTPAPKPKTPAPAPRPRPAPKPRPQPKKAAPAKASVNGASKKYELEETPFSI